MSSGSSNDSYIIKIKNLKTIIKIGITEEERLNPQTLFFNCTLSIDSKPKGCVTDDISDTICYHTVCKQIISLSKEKEFHLLEKLNCHVYDELISYYRCSIFLSVKKKPKIEGLEQGYVTFSIGNKS